MNVSLSSTATGRNHSLFDGDVSKHRDALSDKLRGKRVLVVGGAGSIGSSTVHEISRFVPRALHVVDQNENALAELVRELRSSSTPIEVDDFKTMPIDYGAAAMKYLMLQEEPYDLILNFAAIKHVRSEKDIYSIIQMIDTNIVKQARFRNWIAATSPKADYFSVSTDKAANPVSFMGATKRLMEHVLFHGAREIGCSGRISTARFANVAYSNGSLLQAFERRLARGEPLACPEGIARYFVSLKEAGQICMLSSVLSEHESIIIPRLNPQDHLVNLDVVAKKFLKAHGLEASVFYNEDEARSSVEACKKNGKWPLLLTQPTTAGEKPFEEFIGKNEAAYEVGMAELLAVKYLGVKQGDLEQVLSDLEAVVLGRFDPSLNKDFVKSLIGSIEPDFLSAHIESKLNLDQRV